MARNKKNIHFEATAMKGKQVLVTWPKDGHAYAAKVVGMKENTVKVHYVNYNAR